MAFMVAMTLQHTKTKKMAFKKKENGVKKRML